MIGLNIDRHAPGSYIYQQVYQQLKEAVLKNQLAPHEQLPAKRSLAAELNVSLNSVNAAYQQLIAEGFIYSIERQGYFAEDLEYTVDTEHQVPSLPEDLQEDTHSKMDVSFSHMQVDTEEFPLKKWLKCEQQALYNFTSLHKQYGDPKGIYELRASIAQLIAFNRGVRAHPEQIILGAGTQELMRTLTRLLPEETAYGLEEPGYQRVYQLLKQEKRNVITLPLDDKGIQAEGLRHYKPDVLFTTPSHQFPTGVIMPASRRMQLLNWASENPGRYIIEDDYDSEYKYDTDSIPSLQSLDRHEQVIYMGTFSKSLMPGLRLSYMVLPVQLIRSYQKMQPTFIQSCSTIQQISLKLFIDEGHYLRHTKRMKQVYKDKREACVAAFENVFGDNVTISGAKSGLHFVAAFRTEKTEAAIIAEAATQNIEVYSLSRFELESSTSHKRDPTLIIGFAGLHSEEMHPAVQALYKVIYDTHA
ncbi:GntR family transcriptional regulator [Salsuginibacillus halophilus]|uniref:GntR family transcriptional regulator n=1 Tax=Salsuginibacillus halophilus TaxID=517424 RepID=A0A2P8H9P5_9BACI|nr:PLP-dependent aminotransferase family protein [Salsuginibacillus halophilus]PSL42947.1 GntR family transcriptional regulator [Salsuginibacillus halophilus]